MVTRAILLLVLAMAVLANMGRADDSTQLPSSKASVVLPLLKMLSTNARPTLDEVEKILGESHTVIGNAGGLDCHYTLDDKSDVSVQAFDRPGHELISIVVSAPGKKEEWFYVRALEYSK